jgi:cytosine deaminase
LVDLMLKNCRTGRERDMGDIAVDGGIIVDRGQDLCQPGVREIDVGGRLCIPGFVEPHLHLDIALTNSWELPGREQPFDSMGQLFQRLETTRGAFTQSDIEERAGRALELALRHGVTCVRAQCHVDPEVGLKHLEALVSVRERYAGRLGLQIVAFPDQGLLGDPATKDLFREAFRVGADVMGGSTRHDFDASGQVDVKGHVDAAFELATECDVDLDMHADSTLPNAVRLEDLEVVYLAKKVMECGYQGRVTVGHMCALGVVEPTVALEAIGQIRDAGISVVSLPDMYRLARQERVNVRRGLTRVKELLEAGVNVALGSNNVRDVLRPVGNLDPLEEALILSYGVHMDSVDQLNTLMDMVTYNSAKAIGLDGYGLEVGCRADIVVLEAASPSAAIVDHAEAAFVFKAGNLMARNVVNTDLYGGRSRSVAEGLACR